MYVKHREHFIVDPTGREARLDGLELFNVAANDIDLSAIPSQKGYIPRHWHTELELFLLNRGEVYVEAGGQRVTLRPGEGCFINTGVLHAFGPLNEQSYAYHSLVFGAEVVAGLPGSAFDLRYVRPVLENCPEIVPFRRGEGDDEYAPLFERAFSACREEQDGFEFEARHALSLLLRLVRGRSSGAPSAPERHVREERVKQMLRWIGAHLDEAVTAEDIARAANVGTRECFRLFRQYLHCGPIDYLRQRRILRAAERLSTTDDLISVIALDCGFSTPSYFSKCFQRQMGKTPHEWRDIVRGMQDEPVNPRPDD